MTGHQFAQRALRIIQADWEWTPDFVYSPEQVERAVYSIVSGDAIEGGLGHHRGHPDQPDQAAVTKRQVADAAARGDRDYILKVVAGVFHGQVRRLPSSRVTITDKRSGKRRDIDMPPQGLRPILVLANADLVWLIQIKKALPDTVISYRSLKEIPAYAGGGGATIQDQFAGLVARLLPEYGPFAVSIDLKDHFGQLPHQAIHAALRALGLTRGPRRHLVEVARINSRWASGKRVKTTKGFGIEQGNNLSATLSNLVMGLVTRMLLKRGVQSAMYGDDIVLFATTHEGAERAFRVFAEIVAELGFTNVRPLGTGPKESWIYDTTETALPLIRTYEVRLVDSVAKVGLNSSKLELVRAHLNEHDINSPTPKQVRRAARRLTAATNISKSWMREVGLLPPVSDSTSSPQSSAGRETPVEEPKTPSPTRAAGQPGWGGAPHDHQAPVDDGWEDSEPSVSPSVGGEGGATFVGAVVDVATCRCVSETVPVDAGRPKSSVTHSTCVETAGASTPVTSTKSRASTGNNLLPQADGPNRGGALRSEAPLQACAGEVDGIGTSTSPVPVLARDVRELISQLISGEPPKLDETVKGAVIDLAACSDQLRAISPDQRVMVVNWLLQAIAIENTASVIYHPGDRWTHDDRLLGGEADRAWRRDSERYSTAGVLLTLRRRSVSKARTEETHLPPSGVTCVTVSQRSSKTRRWRVVMSEADQRRQTSIVEVETDVPTYGRVAAVAKALPLSGVVAVPDYPLMGVVLKPKNPMKPTKQSVLAVAARRCRSRVWTRHGAWWVGSEPPVGDRH